MEPTFPPSVHTTLVILQAIKETSCFWLNKSQFSILLEKGPQVFPGDSPSSARSWVQSENPSHAKGVSPDGVSGLCTLWGKMREGLSLFPELLLRRCWAELVFSLCPELTGSELIQRARK